MRRPRRPEKKHVVPLKDTLNGIPLQLQVAPTGPAQPLDVRGLARWLGVHPMTILRHTRRGLPHFRIGNRLRYDPAQVVLYLKDKNRAS